MARIRGKDTGPERAVSAILSKMNVVFERHVKDLPGRPDFVLRAERIAIFVDGDFWHGWRFPAWRHKLSERWEAKIELNRNRDIRNHRKLRQRGWKVFRIWEHQVTAAQLAWVDRLEKLIEETWQGTILPGNVDRKRRVGLPKATGGGGGNASDRSVLRRRR
jgi:DNA mismatch endonuclease (patch repair protein)